MSNAVMDPPAGTMSIAVPEEHNTSSLETRLLVAADRISLAYTGLRVHIGRPRYQRCFSRRQIEQATAPFGADCHTVSMSKKLFNAREPAVKQLRAVYSRIVAVIKDPHATLPYPDEPGVRLVKRGHAEEIDRALESLVKELHDAAEDLQRQLPAIAARAASSQGELYDARDYQFNAHEAAYVTWSFPALTTVDPALAETSPRLSQKQEALVREMLVAACRAKEDEMALSMCEMLSRLVRVLEPTGTGQPSIFRNSSVTKIFDALDHAEEQFHENSIGDGPLKEIFDRLRQTIRNHRDSLPEELRAGGEQFRQQIREQFQQIGQNLVDLSEVKVKRAIIRRAEVVDE